MKRLLVIMMLFASVAYATPTTSVTIPNNFTPNTTIQSSQVNSNFTEVQNQYNSHSHNDITQVGAITNGSWLGTVIATNYGGTGQDFSTEVQGTVPFFSGAGTMDGLAPGTGNYVLTTNGTGANPTWTAVTTRNAITSGFEVSASVAHTAIWVYGGTLMHKSTGVEVSSTTILTFATAGDWASGATVNYGGGAGWCYIGVRSNASSTHKGVFLLGANPPTSSDGNGKSSGQSLYSYDGTYWYRVVGAVRVNTSNLVSFTTSQNGSEVTLDRPIEVSTTTSAGAWRDQTLVAVVPALSTYVTLGGYASQAGGPAGIWFKAHDYAGPDAVGNEYQDGIYAEGCNGVAGEAHSFTDASQVIQYFNFNPTTTTSVSVKGYRLNIR